MSGKQCLHVLQVNQWHSKDPLTGKFLTLLQTHLLANKEIRDGYCHDNGDQKRQETREKARNYEIEVSVIKQWVYFCSVFVFL